MQDSTVDSSSQPANTATRGTGATPARAYALLIFISAWLVFQVQPLIGKFILPWFGSAAALWSAVLVFFQLLLLAGYTYAHLLSSHFARPTQIRIHLGLLVLAFLCLPIIPDATWEWDGVGDPVAHILLLLLVTVGGPYFMLSATTPLFQRWFADQYGEHSPYRLYAVSNAGSLLGLFTYPFLLEPLMTRQAQAWLWSAGFAAFAVLAVPMLWRQLRSVTPVVAGSGGSVAEAAPPARQLLWLLLAALPSALLVASPTKLAMELPPMPLVFVVLLGLYLLSFIIAFDSPRWYRRGVFVPLLLIAAFLPFADELGLTLGGTARAGAYLLVLFAVSMACHGELSRLKPDPQHLTAYYLLLAAGGALGGLLAALGAPMVFNDIHEYDLVVVSSLALILFLVCRNSQLSQARPALPLALPLLATLGYVTLVEAGSDLGGATLHDKRRNFYGLVEVREWSPDGTPLRSRFLMAHNNTVHGMQFADPRKRNWTNTYYGAAAGVGRAILAHPNHGMPNAEFRMGVVGLGAGVLSVYTNDTRKRGGPGGDHNDTLVFYEIDPDVIALADSYFSYLHLAQRRGVDVSVVEGDARKRMEEALEAGEAGNFDLLVLDAFSGDSAPAHLLTREALAVYRAHLREGGVLAFNATSRHLDLLPILRGLARDAGLQYRLVLDPGDNTGHTFSRWVILTNSNTVLINLSPKLSAVSGDEGDSLLWTDDYNSLLDVLKY